MNAELDTVKARLVAKLDYRNIIIQQGHNGSHFVNVMDMEGVPQDAKKLLSGLNPEIEQLENRLEKLLLEISELVETT